LKAVVSRLKNTLSRQGEQLAPPDDDGRFAAVG